MLKNFLLYLFLCGFPRLFAMAWPAIVAWLEKLMGGESPPQNEERAEAKPPPSPKKRSKKRNRRSRANPRRAK